MATKREEPASWHVLHYLPERAGTLLDVGCNVGELLLRAHEMGIPRLFGIELNPDAAETARARLSHVAHCVVYHGSADQLPMDDACVDVATCCEVMEHIPEALRPQVIAEVARVLKPGGLFIITVPHDGLFAPLDAANMRFRLPKLFAAISYIAGGRGRDAGYENQKHGIVWHHHFRMPELRALLGRRFRIKSVRWRGSLLAPLGEWILFPFYRKGALGHPVFHAVKSLQAKDMAMSLGPFLAYDVLIVAERATDG